MEFFESIGCKFGQLGDRATSVIDNFDDTEDFYDKLSKNFTGIKTILSKY